MPPENRRILIVDDNPQIHADFRKILSPDDDSRRDLRSIEEMLFGEAQASENNGYGKFDLAFASQGEEALHMVRMAAEAGTPFAASFVDIRMPPGWDGVETVRKLWQEFPEVQVVICTAYSDYSWNDIVQELGHSDSLLIIKKPFDIEEVQQAAQALTKKWDSGRDSRQQIFRLDQLVRQRTKGLLHSEECFAKAFHASPLPIIIQPCARPDYLNANDAFFELTGHPRELILGSAPAKPALWASADTHRALLELLEVTPRIRDYHTRIRNAAGQERDVTVAAELLEMDGESFLLIILQDISDRLRMDEQLRQSQKLEAVGRLATGIAHDFNNALTVILGQASRFVSSPSLDPQIREALEQVVSAAERATELTGHLLTYSRRQSIRRTRVRVPALLEETTQLLRHVLGERITLDARYSEYLPSVFADLSSMKQVLINLALNARDAMPCGGKLSIRASSVRVSSGEAASHPDARAGDYICIIVADTGIGMDSATKDRIFDPFFTTKAPGMASGMGLSIVYGIIRQHCGWITVESVPDFGSTFRLFLPLLTASDAPALPNSPAELNSSDVRAYVVMVVEDELLVREFIAALLASAGCVVITAANSAEALEKWRNAGRTVQLLITDIILPDALTGVQLADLLVAEAPNLKVILTSGYGRETPTNSRVNPAYEFLPKPYHSEKLIKMVAQVLHGVVAENPDFV